jgi:CheY-like chemotaxis protein
VCVASGGREALDLLAADPRAFDAVLLDLTMPDIGGEEAFAALRAVRADLPVILMTGYAAADAAGRFPGLDGFVRKPWEPEDLVAAIARAVGEPTADSPPD